MKDTGKEFARADVHTVFETTFAKLQPADYEGHETYANDEEMYATFRRYHGDVVGPDTVVKIVRFTLDDGIGPDIGGDPCTTCGGPSGYDEKYDATYCRQCNRWLEHGCDDASCEYCKKRPATPIQ